MVRRKTRNENGEENNTGQKRLRKKKQDKKCRDVNSGRKW